MANFDLTPFDITTPKPGSDGATALTVSGECIEEVKEFAWYESNYAVLWAPTSGATTASVNRTRAELKAQPFCLDDHDEHIARLTAKVDRVNWKGSFVVIQAHCHGYGDPTLKGFIETEDGCTGTFKVGLRTEAGGEAPPKQVVFEGINLAQPFTVQLRLKRGGAAEAYFEQGGQCRSLRCQLSAERAARLHVFHWGAYNQVDQGHPSEPKGDGTRLKVLDILECHWSPVGDAQAFLKEIKAACKALEEKLNTISNQIDNSNLDGAQSGPLYTRIRAIKNAVRSAADENADAAPEQNVDDATEGALEQALKNALEHAVRNVFKEALECMAGPPQGK
jgi:hypothetical protein